MLQQTTVAAVIPYYECFLKRFPTLKSLADAPESDVLTLWSGLGYYSRARNLLKGAKYVQEVLSGRFPKTRDEALEIPGVGPYTAGAILSIAFDLKVPLVDGNVQRVFARYFGVFDPVDSSAASKKFWELAQEAVQACASPRVFNQALMELGATICTKGSPKCPRCPIAKQCYARLNEKTESLPVPKKRKETVDLHWAGFVIEADGKVFLRKNKKGEWWSDLWDFPRVESTAEDLERHSQYYLKKLKVEKRPKKLGMQKHTVTHHRIHVTPYHVHLKTCRHFGETEGEWVKTSDLRALPTSSLVQKLLRLL